MTTARMITRKLEFLDWGDENVVGYTLSSHANGDDWDEILVIFNGSKEKQRLEIPKGNWTVVVNGEEVNENGIDKEKGTKLNVPPITAMVLYR